MWNLKGIVKLLLKKKNKVGRLILPDFKTYYKAAVLKTLWYCHKDRHVDQWNRTDSAEISPGTHSQLVFDKCAKTIQ